tara:strand:- start:1811 stop:2143 length:333 start_codon:yes stop_codon:yes gene_type:complete
MKTASVKAKGRTLQKWLVEALVKHLGLSPLDVESRPMSAAGEDIIMGNESRKRFPMSVECKNQEHVNVWKAYEQAEKNTPEGTEACVVIKRNRSKPLVVVDAEYFIKLFR